jgi:NADP-dependent 3-hydroxy acid dehydrogenase YdfG
MARSFAARGCTIGLVARDREALEALAAELPGAGHLVLTANVADAGSIATAAEEFGAVDVLVVNAGLTHYMPFAELTADKAHQMNSVNWVGTLNTVWAALPGMLERRRGPRDHVLGRWRARLPRRCRLQRHQGGAARLRRGAPA